MSWNVEFTDEFGGWYQGLLEAVQDDIDRMVGLLEAKGPQLPFPYSSGIEGSRHPHMRELRIQSGGEPYRVFYAFDPAGPRFCWSAATRLATADFTRR